MDSVFGNESFAFGPGRLYWDTASGGENINLGDTDSITLTASVEKIDLMSSQYGASPADKAVSVQKYQIKCGLAKSTVERLEKIVQGFHVERDSNNDIKRLWGSNIIGQRDSSIAKQLTFVEIVDGVESTDPLRIIDFWKAAPSSDSIELVYDAATQRYYGVMFECYKDEAQVDDEGRATYWASREVA